MSKINLAPIFRVAKIVTLAALAVAVCLLGLYFFNFGPQNNYSLSTSASEWSNFGSYAGGVLGPLFSFLAFAGVLLTNWLQGKQLEHAKAQANIEEFQRVIANISLQIDSFLREKIENIAPHINAQSKPEVVYTYLMIAGTAAIRNRTDYILQVSDQRTVDSIKPAITSIGTLIGFEINQLAWSIDEFKRLGGADSVCKFYERRYSPIVCWLHVLSFLDHHPEIKKVWDVLLLRRAMTQ